MVEVNQDQKLLSEKLQAGSKKEAEKVCREIYLVVNFPHYQEFLSNKKGILVVKKVF